MNMSSLILIMAKEDMNTSGLEPHKKQKTYLWEDIVNALKAVFWRNIPPINYKHIIRDNKKGLIRAPFVLMIYFAYFLGAIKPNKPPKK